MKKFGLMFVVLLAGGFLNASSPKVGGQVFVLWETKTWGHSDTDVMQGDGNLVIYDKNSGSPIWASNTCGHPGAQLVTQNGDWFIYDPSVEQPIWSLSSVDGPVRSYRFLPWGDYVTHSALVAYSSADPDPTTDAPVWGVGGGNPPYSIEFQEDGNVVIYDANHNENWKSNTTQNGVGMPSLAIQNGTLVINYSRALWNTGTGGHPGATLNLLPDGNFAVWWTN